MAAVAARPWASQALASAEHGQPATQHAQGSTIPAGARCGCSWLDNWQRDNPMLLFLL